jgi:hypothetical protein
VQTHDDCNDTDSAIYPVILRYDGKDNDCNGQIDEGLSTDARWRRALYWGLATRHTMTAMMAMHLSSQALWRYAMALITIVTATDEVEH